jgi:serine/threonine protein phosphatase PrpC
VRTSNQDAFVEVGAAGLWVVADGMGGYREGDVAARMVCEGLTGLDAALTFEAAVAAVRRALSEVNARLHQVSVRPVNPVISGSTVAMLLTRRTSAAVLWAGDSRVYRLRYGKLAQLTTDHTWATELNLPQTTEEADHAITRAVGGEDTLLLDVRRDKVRLGDRFLLCSDGLTRELSEARIAALLGEGDAQQCVAALVQATLEAGARDNVTAVVIDAQ